MRNVLISGAGIAGSTTAYWLARQGFAKAVAIHPARGRAIAAFMFRAPEIAHFDHRDRDQHKRLLLAAYSGAGWLVPEPLEQVRVADDLFFDAVSRVHVGDWSPGRASWWAMPPPVCRCSATGQARR